MTEAMCTHIQQACHLVTLSIETMGCKPISAEIAMCDNCLELLACAWDSCSIQARYIKVSDMKNSGNVKYGVTEIHDRDFKQELAKAQILRDLGTKQSKSP